MTTKCKLKPRRKFATLIYFKKYFQRKEITVEGAVAVGAGATSTDDAVNCSAKVLEAEGEEVDFLELGGY